MSNKMHLKKILPIIAGIAIAGASASSLVSCVAPMYAAGVDGQRVVVATDGGLVNDNSFNQDAYVGVKNFVKDAFDLDGTPNYVEAGGADLNNVLNGYRLALAKGANVIVTPGFVHESTLPVALPQFLNRAGVNIVVVDGYVKAENTISLKFNSQISGVMAGYDTSYLFTHTYNIENDPTSGLKYDVNNDGKIKLGTFAGASDKYGVDNYMWGLLLGMAIYNNVAEANNWAKVETANATERKGATSAFDGNIGDIQTTSSNDKHFNTGDFSQGTAALIGLPDELYKNGADVIFPVAGPQIEDVLGYQPANGGKKPYVIGVDVDQAAEYTKYAGRFVTSAIKNISRAVPEAIYRASKIDEDGKVTGQTLNSKLVKHQGDWTYGNFETKDHWLGTKPEPFIDWSIDYVDGQTPNKKPGEYLLKQNYIKLFGEDKMSTAAGAMKKINDHFAALGETSVEYMNGDDIVKLAADIFKDGKLNGEIFDLTGATKVGDK